MNRYLSAGALALGAWLTFGVQTPGALHPGQSAELRTVGESRFMVPAGFDVRLFAGEAMVVSPAAMTWDERGRLWVVELHQHLRAPKNNRIGRIKILEDTDADGRADKDADIRRWAARLTGERGYLLKDCFDRLSKLAKDSDLSVRTAAAIAARQFVSGNLTRDTPPKIPITEVVTGGILNALFLNSSNNVDETFEFHFWMALEPIMAFDPNCIDNYHGDGARKQWPFSANVLRKITRLISETGDEAILSRSILELDKISKDAAPALVAGLQGLLDGRQRKTAVPNAEAMAVISKLARSQDAAVATVARRLERRFTGD